MTDSSALEPRRHAPPAGWSPAVFEAVADAIAAALVAAVRRRADEGQEAAERYLSLDQAVANVARRGGDA